MMKKSIAAALALGFLACILFALPITTAQAGCVWRGSAPYCDDHCANGETLSRTRQDGCIYGNKELCCTEEEPPPAANAEPEPHPATQDTKTPGVGNAATEMIHEGKKDTKTPGVGNAANEMIHEGKKDKKTPGVGSAATEVIPEKPATPSTQQSSDQTAEGDDDGHHHKKHKHKKKHPDND